jgi:GT2 family glycosyltransferase
MIRPALSIVIVSYNAKADLERCLQSLHDHPPDLPHELVVVDNASSDGSCQTARQWPKVRVIEAGSNLGFARGNNLGIRESAGELLLLLNSDTIVPAGAVDALAAELQQRPDAAVIGPRLINGHGEPELSFGSMLSPWAELQRKYFTNPRAIDQATRRDQTPDWVTGACLLVRRSDAEAVGLFDERYFMYEEDVDFCAAIRARGRRILFTPRVEVVHLRGRSSASAPSATRAAYHRSHLAFYEKHHPQWAWLLRAWMRMRGVRLKPEA